FRYGRFGFGAKHTESLRSVNRTNALCIPKQRGTIAKPSELHVEPLIQFTFQWGRVVNYPSDQVRNRIRSDMLDGFLGLFASRLLLGGKLLHPLTQPLPPILRLRRRRPKRDSHNSTQHRNPNQQQKDSSLTHSIIIM